MGINMLYKFRPRGVCAQEICIEIDDNNIVQKLEATGGCSGNLQGIASLVEGMPAKEIISKLKGICCGFKKTSCPDQLAIALEQFLQDQLHENQHKQ